MFAKKCPYCKSSSFSASDRGAWICPGCGKDLALIAAKPAGASSSAGCSLKKNIAVSMRRKKNQESEQPAAGSNVFYIKFGKPRVKR
jgi:ribosomal protein L37AE/L43A